MFVVEASVDFVSIVIQVVPYTRFYPGPEGVALQNLCVRPVHPSLLSIKVQYDAYVQFCMQDPSRSTSRL